MVSQDHQGVESITPLLRPRSIAVIGAGRRPGSIGHELFVNLLHGGFTGAVYPVNPNSEQIEGVPAYPSVNDIPEVVDIAVIAVSARFVLDVARQCAAKGVKGMIVISAGFREVGAEGAALEQELATIAGDAGIRLVGPNCMGVANMNPAIGMNATFSPVAPLAGPVAFMSQSGAVGIAVLQWARRLGLGISNFVSVGNKADVSGNDVIEYWEQDPETSVILLYLESFGNPRKFARLARRITRTKPIVAVKSGRSKAGERAALSHTAAAASSDTAVDTLFRQAGVIRVDTLEELFEVAQVLAYQPLPTNGNVAIVGNSGGPGILAADACEAAGLTVTTLSPHTTEALEERSCAEASVNNPVDMVASATADNYEFALRRLLEDDNVGSVLVIFTPTLVAKPNDVYEAIVRASANATKPIVVNFLALDDVQFDVSNRPLPRFRSPEAAAYALGKVVGYRDFLDTPTGGHVTFPNANRDDARCIVECHRGEGDMWLDGQEAAELMASFGIRVAGSHYAVTRDEAVEAARAIGRPVALKAAAGELVHKSDEGGVVLNLSSPDAVGMAFDAMAERLGARMGGAVVQEMVHPGVETMIGVVQDPSFGPLLLFGMGGTAADLINDRSFRLLPITDRDADQVIRSLRMSQLLFGYRGTEPVDVDGLKETLLRFAALVEEIPEIREADLNPVIVSPDGTVVVDAKVHLSFNS